MNGQGNRTGGFRWVLMLAVFIGGCQTAQDLFKTDSSRFLSPEKVIKAKAHDRSPISPILPSVGLTDESQELVPNATFPSEGDWEYTDEDYVIGPTDLLDISVLDLFSEGLETTVRRQVTAGGFIDMPLLPERIKAEGLTALELKAVIADAYSPEILLNPTVSVTVAAQRQSTFSILGAIRSPGTYAIMRRDMRLLDALALAGDVSQTNIRYIYVIRPAPAIRRHVAGKTPAEVPGASKGAGTSLGPLPEIPKDLLPAGEKPAEIPATKLVPADQDERARAEAAMRELGVAMPGTVPTTQPETQPAPAETPQPLPGPSMLPRLAETQAPASGTTSTAEVETLKDTRTYKWVYSDGRWIRVAQEAPPASQPSGEGTAPVRPVGKPVSATAPVATSPEKSDPYGWGKIDRSDMARIIAVNLEKLQAGDPRMNIIVRDNDIIQIPVLRVGEFYVMGEVARPGVYSLTGRRITVKMALAAAGNLGPLAWPENSLLIRRIGDNQEQVIPLDIEAIFRNEKVDIFLKPDDVIAVGTDVRASFMAVVRNAFRMTYGFGFIYDRNFSEDQSLPSTSKRFTRW